MVCYLWTLDTLLQENCFFICFTGKNIFFWLKPAGVGFLHCLLSTASVPWSSEPSVWPWHLANWCLLKEDYIWQHCRHEETQRHSHLRLLKMTTVEGCAGAGDEKEEFQTPSDLIFENTKDSCPCYCCPVLGEVCNLKPCSICWACLTYAFWDTNEFSLMQSHKLITSYDNLKI